MPHARPRRLARLLSRLPLWPADRRGFGHTAGYVPLRRGVSPTAILHGRDRIHVHPDALINDHVVIQAGEGVTVAAKAQVNYFTVILGGSGVHIGENVLIGPQCLIAAANHDFRQTHTPMRFAGGVSRGPVIIENNAWIGGHATITDGVTIGEEAVVAAGSVVTRDVPAWSIVRGVPARVVRDRRDLPAATPPAATPPADTTPDAADDTTPHADPDAATHVAPDAARDAA